MRMVRYLAPGGRGAAVGVLDGSGEQIAEVPATGGDLGPLLLLDRAALEHVASAAITHHRLDDVRLLAPLDRPTPWLLLQPATVAWPIFADTTAGAADACSGFLVNVP